MYSKRKQRLLVHSGATVEMNGWSWDWSGSSKRGPAYFEDSDRHMVSESVNISGKVLERERNYESKLWSAWTHVCAEPDNAGRLNPTHEMNRSKEKEICTVTEIWKGKQYIPLKIFNVTGACLSIKASSAFFERVSEALLSKKELVGSMLVVDEFFPQKILLTYSKKCQVQFMWWWSKAIVIYK